MSSANSTPVKVLLYSSNKEVREAVLLAVGRRPASDLPVVEWIETATAWATIKRMDEGGIDLFIADGESQPAGGLGLCRQMKNEIYQCPPVLVLTGRPQDAWLAAWSQADAAVPQPLDALELATAVEQLLRPVVSKRQQLAVDPLS